MGKKLSGFIISALEQGMSGREILEMLRRQGLGYRTSVFYQDLRILKGAYEIWDAMKYVPKEKVISERHYQPAIVHFPEKYITVFRVEQEDVLTGESEIKYVAIRHDTTLPRWVLEEKLIESIEEWAEESPELAYKRIKAVVPVRGLRKVSV
jgi:hypothetical protein